MLLTTNFESGLNLIHKVSYPAQKQYSLLIRSTEQFIISLRMNLTLQLVLREKISGPKRPCDFNKYGNDDVPFEY